MEKQRLPAVKENVLENKKRKTERIQSSLTLLLDACRYWADAFDNTELLNQIMDMEFVLSRLDLASCPDDSVNEIENVTINLVTNMDRFLKSMGEEGIAFSAVQH